ncbi:MAG: LacI family DNA-binding transcriptional regulator [Candidatus Nanopelagicales bacterium]
MTARAPSSRPTLEMVAAAAGVSRGTASRVLSGATNVSPAAVEAVHKAASDLRYRPNLSARSLVTGRTGLVGLVVNESNDHLFSDPYFAEVARGAHDALSDADVAMVLTLAGDARERDRLIDLAALRLDGLLVIHGHSDVELVRGIERVHIPAVFSGRVPITGESTVWYVDADNRGGARAATEHLLARGRRRVATITGPRDMAAGNDRLAGWVDAVTAAGLPASDDLIEPGDFSTDSGRRAMEALLARVPDLDALYIANDLMALGAMAVLADHGRTVPDDVAIVGFDDVEAARTSTPPLTTVSQPMADIGRRMAELLLAQLADPELAPVHEVLPTTLVVRDSA